MVRIEDLSVAFGPAQVLRDVTLEIPAGAFVSLVGPSGCGKSTLLRTVAGLVRPVTGGVSIAGRRVEGCSLDVGFLFQEDALLPWRTALENVGLGLRFRGRSAAQTRREAEEWLGRMGLGDFGHHYPHELSGGMKKRVALAQVLAPRPRLLLMDEPFASLDAIVRHLLEADFVSLVREERLTVLLVTHDLEEALLLSDQVALMSATPSARIRQRYEVPFSFPRNLVRLRADPAFCRLLETLWYDLETEVTAMGWRALA